MYGQCLPTARRVRVRPNADTPLVPDGFFYDTVLAAPCYLVPAEVGWAPMVKLP